MACNQFCLAFISLYYDIFGNHSPTTERKEAYSGRTSARFITSLKYLPVASKCLYTGESVYHCLPVSSLMDVYFVTGASRRDLAFIIVVFHLYPRPCPSLQQRVKLDSNVSSSLTIPSQPAGLYILLSIMHLIDAFESIHKHDGC